MVVRLQEVSAYQEVEKKNIMGSRVLKSCLLITEYVCVYVQNTFQSTKHAIMLKLFVGSLLFKVPGRLKSQHTLTAWSFSLPLHV